MNQVMEASRVELIAEVERLRILLWQAGICPDCMSEIRHCIDEPFAECDCTPDMGFGEATIIPTIAKLRYDLHVVSFVLFKMSEGVINL